MSKRNVKRWSMHQMKEHSDVNAWIEFHGDTTRCVAVANVNLTCGWKQAIHMFVRWPQTMPRRMDGVVWNSLHVHRKMLWWTISCWKDVFLTFRWSNFELRILKKISCFFQICGESCFCSFTNEYACMNVWKKFTSIKRWITLWEPYKWFLSFRLEVQQ